MADNIGPGLAEALAEYIKRKTASTTKTEPSDDSPQPSTEARQNGACEPGKVQSA